MKTPGSRKWSLSRMRSPSSAPCVNGLEGSTETTPTVVSRSRTSRISAETRLDFPTPGGPVRPTAYALPVCGIEVGDEVVGERIAVLDERDRACERTPVAGANAGGECLTGPVAAAGHRARL